MDYKRKEEIANMLWQDVIKAGEKKDYWGLLDAVDLLKALGFYEED